jgi:hypothetical protein
MTNDERHVLTLNSRLQGSHRGRRCFVIGNGPSLADEDIGSLGGEVTVVMNAFNQHPSLRMWQPTIHCRAEPGRTYMTPERLESLRRQLEGYESTIHVFPIQAKPALDRARILPPERLAYVRMDRVASEHTRIDLTQAIPSAPDTSILAVAVAIAIGCSPIVLLGVDYDWLSHRSVQAHFYDSSAVPWSAEDLGTASYLEDLKAGVICWESHAALREIALRGGQEIVNATRGSFLDTYPRTTLGAVLARQS